MPRLSPPGHDDALAGHATGESLEACFVGLPHDSFEPGWPSAQLERRIVRMYR
jgi:hypothetical protein